MRDRIHQRGPNAGKSQCEIALNVFAAQTDESDTASLEDGLTNLIEIFAPVVDRAIYLDNETRARCEKVDDEPTHGMLTLEAYTIQTPVP